eukprot:gene9524-biopygen666
MAGEDPNGDGGVEVRAAGRATGVDLGSGHSLHTRAGALTTRSMAPMLSGARLLVLRGAAAQPTVKQRRKVPVNSMIPLCRLR